MVSLGRCELVATRRPGAGDPHPGIAAPGRIDKQALFAVLVKAGQPLCVEHAMRTRWRAAQAGENLPEVRGLGRRVAQVVWALIVALAHGLAQGLQ